jgi:signal peptidase II
VFWVTLAVAFDQVTKYIASIFLQFRYISIFNFFYLSYITNRGIAFGLFAGVKEVVIYLSLAIVLGISLIPSCVKISKSTERWLAFIVGGALGNLIDRIRFGYVIDFITMKFWPTVFNVADMFIFFGSLGLLVTLLKKEYETNKMHKSLVSEGNRREIGGYTGHITRRWLEIRQISNGKNPRLDIKNIYPESDKKRRGNGEWDFEEAELQGEIWGYNYLECSGNTTTSGDSSRKHPS